MFEGTWDETVAMEHLTQTVSNLQVEPQQLSYLLPQIWTEPVREDCLWHEQTATGNLQGGIHILWSSFPLLCLHTGQVFGPVVFSLQGEPARDLFLDEAINWALGHGLLESMNGVSVEKSLVVFGTGVLKLHTTVDQQHFIKLLPIGRPNQLEMTNKGRGEETSYLLAPGILLHPRQRFQNSGEGGLWSFYSPGRWDAGAQRGKDNLIAELKVLVYVRDNLRRRRDRWFFLGDMEELAHLSILNYHQTHQNTKPKLYPHSQKRSIMGFYLFGLICRETFR